MGGGSNFLTRLFVEYTFFSTMLAYLDAPSKDYIHHLACVNPDPEGVDASALKSADQFAALPIQAPLSNDENSPPDDRRP